MPLSCNRIDRSLLIIALFIPIFLQAQPFRREVASIPVSMLGAQVAQPFAGGINTPNHRFVDIDGDGDLDLFVFDDDLNVDFYRNAGTAGAPRFELQPDAIQLPSFQTYFLFLDLNADGLIDLVTDDFSSGARYYRNTGTRQQPLFTLQADPMLDADGHPLFAGFSSIPSFGDFNGDGLMDFISTNTADGSINYYENRGTAAQPSFKFITGSFQGITIIGDTCITRFSASRLQDNQHGAGAYFAADADANGTTDIFYGDIFSGGLFFLKNAGSATTPFIECGSVHYPPNQPVATAGFNEATLTDVDGDGDLDLFVGVLNTGQRHSFWQYENTGSAAAPHFQLRTTDYLSVVDVGQNSSPTLVDIDDDGTLDMVAGNLNGQLWYFHNDGTPSTPSFTLVDTMFAGIAGSFAYAPVFADIYGTGRNDIIVGQFNGIVKFYRNVGLPRAPQYDLDPGDVDSLQVGKFDAAPALVDIDGDGDLDLFVGKSDGTLTFYRNDGNATAPVWVRVTEFFQNIYVVESAKPVFRDTDNDGDPDLLIGDAEGNILFYENYGTAQSPAFRCSVRDFVPSGKMRNASPALGDIDGDGDLDAVIGTSKGGLQFYRNMHAGGPFVSHSVRLVSPPANDASQRIPVTFKWTTSGCAIRYALQVAWDSNFIAQVFNDTSFTDTSALVSNLTDGTRYFWRVRTRFEGGQVVFSETRSFTTAPTIPPAPRLLLPVNQAFKQPLTLQLVWASSTGADRYHVQLSTDRNFNRLEINDSTVTETSYVAGPLARADRYYWHVSARNSSGQSAFSEIWEFTTVVLAPFLLSQNYPNPVRSETRITFSLSTDDQVKLSLYNMLGQLVATLVNQPMAAGEHVATWNGSDFPSGVYYYRLVTRSAIVMKKLIVTK